MNRKYFSKAISFGLALTLACSIIPAQAFGAERTKNPKADTEQPEVSENNAPQDAEEREMESIEIRTVDDFLEFADRCHMDSWSENKYVTLKQDLDLSGIEPPMIPVFAGVFDGEGHTVSGLQYAGNGYIVGLFRYIQKDGIVQNLNIKGNITGTNEKECIGSLCGVNYGMIKNCGFHGNVSGRDTIGGIAGINESTGTVANCTAEGRVTGYYATGGIAGKNHGIIDSCVNQAGINDDSEWVEEDDEMGVGLFFSLNVSEDSDAELFSGVDAGGVAGYSDGMVIRCSNYGKVGYEHAGYNIGGIAGRQAGVVSLCTNNGTVLGRKDVGGIVGQMEPFIEIDEAESLRNAVNRLHDLIGKTIDDMQAGKNVLRADFDSLTMYGDAALESGDTLAGQMTDFVDSNIEEVEEIAGRMEHISDRLPDILKDVSGAGSALQSMNGDIKKLLKDLDVTGKLDGNAYDETDYGRISLLSTVGGRLRCDRSNPEENETVTVTAVPDEGYDLKDTPRAADANGNTVSLAAAGDHKYSFTMPKRNVKVSAEFVYVGAAPAKEGQGGNIQTGALENGNAADDGDGSSGKTENKSDQEAQPEDKTAPEAGTVSEDKTAPEDGAVSEDKADPESESTSPDASVSENVSPSQDTDSGQQDGEEAETPSGNGILDEKPEESPKKEKPQVILSSNLSGDAYCRISQEGIVTLTVVPDASYTLKGNPEVRDADGKGIPLSKRQGSSYDYEFDTNGSFGPYNVTITFQKQNQSDTVDTAVEDIREAVRNLQRASDEVNVSVQKIKDIMTKQDGTIRAWSELNQDEQKQVISEVIHLAAALGDMSEAAASLLSSLSTVSRILSPYISDAAQAAKKDLEAASNDVQKLMDALKSAVNGVKGIVNYVNAQPDIQFSKLGDGFDAAREDLHSQLRGISDSLKNLSSNASEYTDVINDDLRAVNDQLNVVFNLLADHMVDYSDLSIEELYEEISDEDIDTVTTGRTDTCTNKGIVKGDINIGGIAGSMAVDEEDPEESAAGSVEYRIGSRFITKCIINDSVNNGYVTSKKNGAGGIVGYMKHGIVVGCEGYGSVESTEGDYVGGICGESLTVIKRCYALCSASGGKNVGGIAGYAETLKDCCTIVDCEASIGRKGAVAGQIASYENAVADGEGEPEVCRNYYVGDGLYGIDNISYVDVAEPVTYDELLTIENLPTQFRHLKVIYRVEDEELGTEEVRFGDSLANLNYPPIPEKEGYYGVWPDYSGRKMMGNLVVKGEYKENVTVVESGKGTADVAGAQERPYALVEQIFTEDTVLNAGLSSLAPPEEAEGREHVVYDLSLENSGIGSEDTFAVRIYSPYEDAQAWGYLDGKWTKLESKKRGQYLQVDMAGEAESFCVAENKSYKVIIIVSAAGGLAVLAVLIMFIKKIGRRRRQKKAQAKEG